MCANATDYFKSLAVQQLVAEHLFEYKAFAIYNKQGGKETIDSVLAGEDNDRWARSLSNEWGRLSQGNDFGTKGTNTIEFIRK